MNHWEATLENKIVAVLEGTAGSGKTVQLIRLAIDMVGADISVIWVNNLQDFIRCDFSNIKRCPTNIKFLIIIDGWLIAKSSKDENGHFFNEVIMRDNLRIIISDNNVLDINKDYSNYVEKEHVIRLKSDENKKILKKIIKKNPEWHQIRLSNSRYYLDTPIYLILFGFAITNTKKQSKKIVVNQMLFNYKRIIKNDLRELYEFDQGLGKAFHYISCLFQEYGVNFTWKAFLIIANYYSQNDALANTFRDYNKNHPICEILSHYMSLYDLMHSQFTERVIGFYDILLISNGLSEPLYSSWHFDDNVKREILDELNNKKEFRVAASLFDVYIEQKGIFKSYAEKKFYYEKIQEILSIEEAIEQDELIRGLIRMVYATAKRRSNISGEDEFDICLLEASSNWDVNLGQLMTEIISETRENFRLISKDFQIISKNNHFEILKVGYLFIKFWSDGNDVHVYHHNIYTKRMEKLIESDGFIKKWHKRRERLTDEFSTDTVIKKAILFLKTTGGRIKL